MAQLSDDCFAVGEALLSVEAAATLIASRVPAIDGQETVPLMAALGRVLAEDLLAPGPLPAFANSAVDGYAFRYADLSVGQKTRLRMAGRVAAGQGGEALPAAAAMRIFTGAPLPPGADTVLMQEDARLEGDDLLVPSGLPQGANARRPGEDVPQGEVALSAGRVVDAPAIGLAAALGLDRLAVRPRLRVGVFSTGNELVEPGQPRPAAGTYDSNRFTLMAMLARLPVEIVDLGILPDRQEETAAALRAAAASHDLLLTSGGVSTGEEDHVRAAIEQAGRLVFWRLAIKPGRPAALGVIEGKPVLGLPGNPVAAVVTFLHLARPLVLHMAGASVKPLLRMGAVADFSYRKKAGRREYLRVSLVADGARSLAHKYPRDGAAMLSSLTASEAFAELLEETVAVQPGDALMLLPFAAIF